MHCQVLLNLGRPCKSMQYMSDMQACLSLAQCIWCTFQAIHVTLHLCVLLDLFMILTIGQTVSSFSRHLLAQQLLSLQQHWSFRPLVLWEPFF